jgi:hypothetical protein
MILDALLQFDAGNNLAQVVGTYVSQNVIDLHINAPPGVPVLLNGQGARDIGIGDDPAMKLLVQVITAFTSAGAATLAVSLQGATDNGAGLPAAFTTWYTSPVYALATIAVAGARLMDMDMPRPPAGVAIPRFLRLSYAIAGATTTAGTINAYLVIDRWDQYYTGTANVAGLGGYPPGITVQN